MDQLRLEVRDLDGPARWRWLLTRESSGAPLADYQVDLTVGSGDELRAFTDLYQFLRWNAVPDRRAASEARIVARVGEWAGREVLGEAIGAAIAAAAPVTVRVVIPEEAGFLLSWPLELAHVGGRPLAGRGDVTFAYDLAAGPSPAGWPADGSTAGSEGRGLRMLAVFSLPSATSVLALRRERYELVRLLRGIAGRQRRRVELHVVQYGVTRERLAAIADAGDGWEVLHLSGHGGRGLFLLEHPDGSPDPVDTADLAALLRPLRHRVRVAVVSACESAAATTAETLRWVGLNDRAEQLEQEAGQEAGPASAGQDAGPAQTGPAQTGPAQTGLADAGPVLTGVARALNAGLGCPVVAMRYPVADDFAIAFAADLYERLLGARDPGSGSRGQPLGTALTRAVARAAGPAPSRSRPVLSVVTPVLLGGDGAGLVLEVPRGEPVLDLALVRMDRFPAEPERFVGRAAAMAAAGAALAPGSGRAGVMLHGMAGSGKTACAVELAYRHQDSFAAAAFWQAPLIEDEFGGALAGLAAALDIQLGGYGFAMSDKITTAASLAAFGPRLRRLLEDNGILLVLDNLETLLTPAGAWRDPRWEPLIAALTGHRGESRLIATSRIPPAGLDAAVLSLPVHALDLAESVALARELPGLRGLLHADAGPVRDTDADERAVAADRDLVRRVLLVVQGHPKLMELADAAAEDPARLADQLAAAEQAADGQALDAFFRDGTTGLDAAQFLDALTTWTTTTLAALLHPARLMAEFLACVEDTDRESGIVDANWADLWRRLGRPGDPPAPGSLLAALTLTALIQVDAPPGDAADKQAPVSCRMHPGVVQAIRAGAAPGVQAAADAELAAFWLQVSSQARRREGEGGEAGQAIVRAGLAAAPYLLRLQAWDTAGTLIEQALQRDESPVTIQAALPALRVIASATRGPKNLGVLARALQKVDPAEAERLLRGALTRAVAATDFRTASTAATDLINLLRGAGRLSDALALAGQKAGYTRQAGLGPWNQIADQTSRLQILGEMGEHRKVLDQIPALQAQMDELPVIEGSNETIRPYNVRETTLDVGRSSAMALGEWHQALDLSADILASRRARRAGIHEITCSRFNDYGPLIRIGRLAEAEELLVGCQQVYEDHGDLAMVGRVLSARADLESARGNLAAATAFEQTAIRFSYARPEPRGIAISHYNLANHLQKIEADPAARRAHRLAAALIYQLTGMTYNLDIACRALALELRRDTDGVHFPSTVDEVVQVAEQTEGVHLGRLITALQSDSQTAVDALARIQHAAAEIDPEADAIQSRLQQWEPLIILIAAAASGDSVAAAQLAPALDELAQTSDWATLGAVLRRILQGDRDASLLDGLDEIDTAIAGQILTRLRPQPRQEHP